MEVRKVIVIKDGINLGLIQLVIFTHSATSIREDTKIRISGKHVFLEVFAPGNLGCFGCYHILFECWYQ